MTFTHTQCTLHMNLCMDFNVFWNNVTYLWFDGHQSKLAFRGTIPSVLLKTGHTSWDSSR